MIVCYKQYSIDVPSFFLAPLFSTVQTPLYVFPATLVPNRVLIYDECNQTFTNYTCTVHCIHTIYCIA